MRPESARFRELLLDAVSRHPVDAPLLLSGGVDSASVLSALLALDRRPRCITFALAPNGSPDSRVASSMAQTFGLDHDLILIPRDDETLLRDVRRTIALTGATRKVEVQCCHAFLYLLDAAAALGAPDVLIGMAAGDLHGTTRKAWTIWFQQGEAAARAFRRDHWSHPEQSADAVIHDLARRVYGITLHDAYLDPALGEFMLDLDMAVIHRGYRKSVVVEAFPEFWSRGAWYRSNSSLQLNSGLRSWHDTLLDSPVNRRGVRAVAALYRDLAEELPNDRP